MTLADAWRSFRTAIGLGWAIESNWSDPFLFAVYTIAKPLAAALILVVMFQVITGGQGTEFLQFMIVGSALWNVVFGVMGGMVQSILEDRERYRMIKYVVVTPTSLFPFPLGQLPGPRAHLADRGGADAARRVSSSLASCCTRTPYLVAASLIGLIAVMSLGIGMAGWCLQLRQEAWHYPEAIAGALYLVSGAIFPVDILPASAADRLRHAHHVVARSVPTWPPGPRLIGSMGSCRTGPSCSTFVSTAVALPMALAFSRGSCAGPARRDFWTW